MFERRAQVRTLGGDTDVAVIVASVIRQQYLSAVVVLAVNARERPVDDAVADLVEPLRCTGVHVREAVVDDMFGPSLEQGLWHPVGFVSFVDGSTERLIEFGSPDPANIYQGLCRPV